MNQAPSVDLICQHRAAQQRYVFHERFEVGLVLLGSEVKSLRRRQANLEGSYASLVGSEVWLHRAHIAPYEQASAYGHEPKRARKLLLKSREIERLRGKLAQKGTTLIATKLYFHHGYAKAELALATNRQRGDKRELLRREQDLKEARAAMHKHRG